MTIKSSYLTATLSLLGVLLACHALAVAQSEPTLQEDFYQPVQELWNRPTVETPDLSSGFPSGGSNSGSAAGSNSYVPVASGSAPSYTQDGIYQEIPAPPLVEPPYASGPEFVQPLVDQTLPEIVGPEVSEVFDSQPPIVSETIPPLPAVATVVAPATTAPVCNAIGSGYPATRSMFFRWDALSGIVDQENGVPIGSPDAAGVFLSNGIPYPFTNSLSTDLFDNNTEWGNRYELGELHENGGWMASYLEWNQINLESTAGGGVQFNDPIGMLLGYADGNEDSIDDDIDGDNHYGRNGIDLGTPDPDNPGMFLPLFDGIIDTPAGRDEDDLLTWVPIFDNLQARSDLDISSFELMKAWRRNRCGGRYGFSQHWLFGIRYIDLDERFSANATGSFFDTVDINSSIENYIIGPQIGTELSRRFGVFRIGGTARFMFAANFLRGEQSGAFGASSGPGGHNQPVNLNPSSFSNVAEDESFSPVLEWRLDAAYDIGKHMAARVGYTGILMGGVGRASNSIEYTLPDFGLSLDADDDLFFNAFTLGLEFYF